MIDGDLKVVIGPERRVFDLAHDPGEEHDVAADHEEALLRTRDQFLEFTRMTLEAARVAPDPESMARLQALGYATSEASSRREGLAPPLANRCDDGPEIRGNTWSSSAVSRACMKTTRCRSRCDG